MSHIYNSARVRVIALNIRKVNRTEMPLPIRLNEYNSTISLLYLFSLVFPLCFSMEMTLVEHVLECGAASTLLIIYIEKKKHIYTRCVLPTQCSYETTHAHTYYRMRTVYTLR